MVLRAIRIFQAEEILRIGLHDVAGSLQPLEVSAQLSDLAEVVPLGRDRRGAAGPGGAPGKTADGAHRARPREPGRARDALRIRSGSGLSLRRGRRERYWRRSPGVVRARLAAVHRHDGGDAGGGAPVSGRHPPAPLGRAGAAGDLLGVVRALPPRRVRRLGAGRALAGAHRLDRRAGRRRATSARGR